MLTPIRARKLLSGQTTLAQKVFEAIPIGEAWSATQIKGELDRQGKALSTTISQIHGCLYHLVGSGLVCEPSTGLFQSKVKLPAQRISKEVNMTAQATPAVTTESLAAAQAAAPVTCPIQKTLERLAALSTEVIDATDVARQTLGKLTRLGKEIEDVAIAITLDREQSAKRMDKLEQLQKLMRELNLAA